MPYVERGECINVGVILFCRTRRFLGALTHLDHQRLLALAPDLDLHVVADHLNLFILTCRGGVEAGSPGQMSQSERFHWLVSPRSTIIQTSPVHCGLCTDPEATLHDLLKKLVVTSQTSSS